MIGPYTLQELKFSKIVNKKILIKVFLSSDMQEMLGRRSK